MPIELHARLRPLAALRNGFLVALALLSSCESPDGSGLFEPFGSNPPGGGGSSGSGAAAGSSGAGLGGSGAGEGQGGSLNFSGSAGLGSGGSAGAPPGDGDAGPDASPQDGGVNDAGPEPPPCVPEDELCDGVDNDCDDDIDEDATCEDDCVGMALEGSRYMFCSEQLDREDAQELCEDSGMRLLWLESPEESDALVETLAALVAGNGELLTHVGGSDEADEGEWFWVGGDIALDGFQFWQGGSANGTGEAPEGAYANFVGAEPNDQDGEDCLLMTVEGGTARQPGQWDDRSCADEFPVTCEVP